MSLNQEDIKHIAELARIKLTPEEEKKFGAQLASVLDYIEQLKEVNTKKVIPTGQVSGREDVWRADEVSDWDQAEREAALNQGEREAGQIKVKRVL